MMTPQRQAELIRFEKLGDLMREKYRTRPELREKQRALLAQRKAKGEMRWSKFSREDKSECAALFVAGEPPELLMRKYKMSRSTFRLTCKGLGRIRPRPDILPTNVWVLRRKGLTLAQLAHKFSCSRALISKRIKDARR